MALDFAEIREALLCGGPLADADFDSLYPLHVRAVSRTFWTPVGVGRRAAELLAPGPSSRILDVGSGVGKFCIVGALHTRAHFSGVEHRPQLVSVAQRAAESIRAATMTSFVRATPETISWESFDGFYFYNPFLENLSGEGRLDATVELSRKRMEDDLRVVLDGLSRARRGARVVTYHGLGADLPSPFRLVSTEGAGSDKLELWVNHGRRGP